LTLIDLVWEEEEFSSLHHAVILAIKSLLLEEIKIIKKFT